MECNEIIIKNGTPTIVKPPIKWVGGKTQIITKILEEFPVEINNYYEIFLGGGSVLLGLLSYMKSGKIKVNGKINVYDKNEVLINLYKYIKLEPKNLYKKVTEIINKFNEFDNEGEINRKIEKIEDVNNKETFYYFIRNKYNKIKKNGNIEASSLFLFLNKTCFRGLYREGPNGFNVPYGNYKNPQIINLKHIIDIHKLIKNVNFYTMDFNNSLNNFFINDFIYLDPPYAPENKTSFVKYNKEAFDTKKHEELFEILNDINERKIKFLMSNSNVKLVRNYFNENKYKIIEILCKRNINSKNPSKKTKEVLIKTY